MHRQLLLSQHLLVMEPAQWQRRVEVMPGDGSTTETASRTDTLGCTEPATETGGETSHSTLLVTQLLKAQTEAMTAQAQVAAVQYLPTFHCYTGEDDQTDDEVFNRWLERFKECAKLAK